VRDAVKYLHTLRRRRLYLWPLTTILEDLMADITQIQSDITALQNAEHAAVAELQALADMVASLEAGNVTAEQLDELHGNLQAVTSGLVAATQSAQAGAGQPHPDTEPVEPPASA
jgi:type II secretory pathway component PulM